MGAMEAVMNVLLMGLSVFAVILASFFVAMGITKGVSFFSRGKSVRPMRSGWVPLQIYSGDDCLGHPDLQKISELRGDRRRAE
jgi:hypothetical protein